MNSLYRRGQSKKGLGAGRKQKRLYRWRPQFDHLEDRLVPSQVTPQHFGGNPACGQLEQDGQNWTQFKVEPVQSGTFSNGKLTVSIAKSGEKFNWSSNISLDAVFVKGGPGGNLYRYDLPGSPLTEATSDTGLVAPNGKGLSHISFCYDLEARISGQKFNDLNGNGVKNAGEPGLQGWTIRLDKDANGIDDTTVTDANGNYSFDDVTPGTYQVREVQQSGWVQTTANPANFTVATGQHVTGIDFGNFKADARIFLNPANDTNAVGIPHTFTVRVEQNIGSGYVKATVGHVSASLTNANGAAAVINSAASTCDNAGDNLDANGECTLVFTSNTAGLVTGNASVSLTLAGATLLRDTDPATSATAGVSGSGPASKNFVDSRISISPASDTNAVNVPHTMTMRLERNLGHGVAWQRFAGQTVSAVRTAGACNFVGASSGTTNASGEFKVTITSATPQTCTIEARYQGQVVPGNPATAVVRASNPDAVKEYVNAGIGIHKTPDRQMVRRGDTVTFTILVTNTGSQRLDNVQVTDAEAPNCARSLGSLASGASTSHTCSLTNVTSDLTSVATVTGKPPVGSHVTDDDDAVVDIINPAIDIQKTPNLQRITFGGTATFTIEATNSGDVALANVQVTDQDTPDCNRALGTLAVGARISYTCALANVTADFTNVAVVIGQPPAGPNVTDQDDVDVDVEPALARLTGLVYIDKDNDGLKDVGESAIGGVTVTLTGTNDRGEAVSASVMTASDGSYELPGLRPGTYAIREIQPAGFFDGKDTLGSLGGSKTNDLFSLIAIAGGENGVHYNFGELRPASLAGYVYVDADNDSFRDGGESGISGVTVTLTGMNDLGQVVSRSLTAANGAYRFANLRPGTYRIRETKPAGFLDGRDRIGSQGGVTGNDVLSNIALRSGVKGINNNFGELRPASLSGFVYFDAENNGRRTNPGDIPIAGATVTLTGINDLGKRVSVATTTDTTGAYHFRNLRPGTYTISETQPTHAMFKDGNDTLGSTGGTVSNDQFSTIRLRPSVDGVEYNFGEIADVSPLRLRPSKNFFLAKRGQWPN